MAVGKTAAVSIPPWIDEEEFRRVVEEVVKRLGGSRCRSSGRGSA